MKKLSILMAALFSVLALQAQDIATARAQPLGTIVTVHGIVTNGDELGPIRYMQDASAGVAAYPGSGSVTFNPMRGDSITVTGELKDYNGLLEIDPITAFTNHGAAASEPAGMVVTADLIGEANEGELLRINDATFADGGGTFVGNNTYSFIADGIPGIIFIRNGHPLAGEDIPVSPVDIIGICAQFTFSVPATDGYQLLPRDENDIMLSSPVFATSPLTLSNQTTSGFDVDWTSNVVGDSYFRYGKTPGFELGVITAGTGVSSHSYGFSSLDAGSIYYVQGYVVDGADTGWSNIGIFATVSNSSGAMKVYFTKQVDNTVSPTVDAVTTSTIEDTIAAYIAQATTTLDVCIYNMNASMESSRIYTAINAAHAAGVDVRYVGAFDAANLGVPSLDAGIPVVLGNTSALMHNKFLIIDRDSDDAWVMSGSTNWTNNNLGGDPNNVIFIQDKSLAQAYTLEFNEMFGSSSMTPDTSESRFGNEKIQNTPNHFIIGGSDVELYFSPSDKTSAAIKNALSTADSDIQFALLVLTRDELAEELQARYDAGVKVYGIVDDSFASGDDSGPLEAHGLDIVWHTPGAQLHHKYALIDAQDVSSDPILITGSHNWSTSAETSNDENTLIIHNADMVATYLEEFVYQFNDNGGNWPGVIGGITVASEQLVNLYPNPASTQLVVDLQSDKATDAVLSILDISGKLVHEQAVIVNSGNNQLEITTAELAAGSYILHIESDLGVLAKVFAVQH